MRKFSDQIADPTVWVVAATLFLLSSFAFDLVIYVRALEIEATHQKGQADEQ